MRDSRASLRAVSLIFIAGSSLAACGGGGSGSSSSSSGTSGPTFHEDVEPLLQKSCLDCHSPGRIAPFSLVKYDEVKPLAGLVAEKTASRAMPPWGALETDECAPVRSFKHDIRLSDEEIAMFGAWSEAGAPEGDPAKAPPPYVPPAGGLEGVDLELAAPVPYVTSGDKDDFRCFVLDPGVTTTRYLNGVHVVPDNAEVVHHAVVFLDKQGASKALAGADGSYPCFGGSQVSSEVVEAWAPGAVPFEFPPNVGTEVPPGAVFVMQVHYHPGGKTAAPDATKFQVRFSDSVPAYRTFFALIGNFETFDQATGTGLLAGPNDQGGLEFRVPAGVGGHVETMQQTVQDNGQLPEIRLYGAGTHMHYVGTDMRIGLERKVVGPGESKSECLVQTPKWDFNWQRTYAYDAPVESLPRIRAGDVVTFRCTYDNTMGNPFVARALAEKGLSQPVDVFLGEQTLDEMCIGLLPVLLPN
jgi:hypothetical protein